MRAVVILLTWLLFAGAHVLLIALFGLSCEPHPHGGACQSSDSGVIVLAPLIVAGAFGLGCMVSDERPVLPYVLALAAWVVYDLVLVIATSFL